MYQYIEDNENSFDCFFFFTYLYAHTWFGLPKVAHKSVLLPLAHDEWTIHLNIWDQLFAKVKKFIFNTESERDFLEKRFANLSLNGPTVGVSVEIPKRISPQSFRKKHGIFDDFIIYIGRVDLSKGCDKLFEYFIDINVNKKIGPSKLVVIGNAVMEIRNHPSIINLGYVDEYTKWSALAACQFLVMPSKYESLSMVLLESWKVSKPVLVNGNCEVLVQQCLKSNGGLWYYDQEGYAKCTKYLHNGQGANVLGRQGNIFVEKNYCWEKIEAQYLDVVDSYL